MVWVQGRGIRDTGRIVCSGVGARERDMGHRLYSVQKCWCRERDKGHRSDSVQKCGCKGEGYGTQVG